MVTGVTVYCDGVIGSSQSCGNVHATRMGRAEYARHVARTEGWTRRKGIDLCPPCSVREYGPHLARRDARREN